MSQVVYKWLNGREATHVPEFRYRLHRWQPAIEGELLVCKNAYHGMCEQDLSYWIARDLFVIESKDEWLVADRKLYTRGPIRIVEHLKGWNKRTARLCAADFAERVLPLFEKKYPNDDRPRLAVQATRDYANGLISKKKLARAADAAWAARAAARAPARAAGTADAADAAWAAVAAGAGWAAMAAGAAVAAGAARAAGAECAWQSSRILEYAYGKVT